MSFTKINGVAWTAVVRRSGKARAAIAKALGLTRPTSASIETGNLFLDWRPSNVSGTTVADNSGNGRTATMVNGATVTTTPSGETAFYTDGVNDYISRTISQSDLSGVDYPITYEYWLYTKGSLSGVALSQVIHNDPNDTIDWHRAFLDKRSGQNRIVTQKYTWSGGRYVWNVNTSITLQDETWYHVVFVIDYNSTNTNNVVKQYVNGSLQSTVTSTYGSSYKDVPWSEGSGDTYLTIGALLRSRNSYYHGYVGDVRFYTDELTSSEISGNFDATKSNYGY